MAKTSFTAEQRTAIETRDRTLLVSAAAGSGKTATLTGRIIASLLDDEHPTTLARLLVVTFTVASAKDMREKISRALDEAIEADPHNARLTRERMLLPSAEISTIDALYNRLLRRHAEEAGVAASYRIPDPAEDALLSQGAMEDLLAELYAGEVEGIGLSEFLSLSDTLTSAKGEDALGEILFKLYLDLCHDVRGLGALTAARDRYAAMVGVPFAKTELGAMVTDIPRRKVKDILAALSEKVALSETVDALDKRALHRCAYAEELAGITESLLTELEACDRPPDVPTVLSPFGRIPNPPKNASDANRALTPLCRALRGLLEEIYEERLARAGQDSDTLCRYLADLSDLLFRILTVFDGRLTEEKARRRLLSFGDVTRRVHALLVKDGKPTATARTIAAGYDQIYIDEFQDVNALQYEILSALSRGDNLFMVGDVKQSIYGFRHADPTIFAALRRAYPALSEGKDGPAAHFFTRNFRCDAPIIDYANEVAGTLFRLAGRTVEYRDEDDLVFAKLAPVGHTPVKTLLFEKGAKTAEGEGEGEPEEGSTVGEGEVGAVAAEIRRLLEYGKKDNGEPIRPRDIAILFPARSAMPPFVEAVSRVCRVVTDLDGDFFLSPEVLLAFSLLNVINNPRRDVYLAAVLRSPVFGFTVDELTLVRLEGKAAPTLYDALVSYLAAHPDFRKGHRFAERLTAWRRVAEGDTVGNLLLTVFHDARLLSLYGRGSDEHHDNLYRLYEYARSFEGTSYAGLYSFISYVNSAIEEEKTILTPAAEGEEEAVTFMTVHKSKGLEFPVVFLCNTERQFRHVDNSTSFIYDKEFGPCTPLPIAGGTALCHHPIEALYRYREKLSTAEEKIRLLYVALTRARERLYVTGSCRNPSSRVQRARDLLTLPTEWSILECGDWLTWILAMRMKSKEDYLLPTPDGAADPVKKALSTIKDALVSLKNEAREPAEGDGGATAETAEDAATAEDREADRLTRELSERLSFVYPDRAVVDLPEKLSVSRLTPHVLDGAEGEESAPPAVPETFTPSVPAFLSGRHRDEAALAGTATHLFLQFADFARLKSEGVEAELARLLDERYLSEEDAARVRRGEVETFAASPLFARILAARRVRRELRFHALLPAADFAEAETAKEALADRTLLVQGVCDCVIEEEDGYCLVDYKTDRVPRDPAAARALLRERHTRQLSYYAAACERLYGTPPREVLIYSLALGESIAVEVE
ncbi:MAG: UvrD-helicase domain-containing protein [Clostridia bacterium]|nr:UvrD-helicase domain-containing protein [Clostridia bacterium]